jgi:uncharacterized protein (DUF433 family)
MMLALPESVRMPLATDAHGVIRVGGTRVTLDSVIYEYLRGSGPDQIAEEFPVLDRADVYYVVGYYLAHREQVDAYLAEQARLGDAMRHAWEAEHPPLTRAELQARVQASSIQL